MKLSERSLLPRAYTVLRRLFLILLTIFKIRKYSDKKLSTTFQIAKSAAFFIYLANIVCFSTIISYFRLFNGEDMNEMSLW